MPQSDSSQRAQVPPWLSKLPNNRSAAIFVAKTAFFTLLSVLLWQWIQPAEPIDSLIRKLTEKILNLFGIHIAVKRGIQLQFYFNLMIPALFFLSLRSYPYKQRGFLILLSTFFLGVLDLVAAVARNYWVVGVIKKHGMQAYATQFNFIEAMVLIGVSFTVMPFLAISGAWLIQSKLPDILQIVKRSNGKTLHPNAPCSCGSGKKYRKCCGKLR